MAVNFTEPDDLDPESPLRKRRALLTELDGPAPSPAPAAQGDTSIAGIQAGGALPVSAVASPSALPGGETPPGAEQPQQPEQPQTPTTPTTPTQPSIPPLPVTGSFNAEKWNNPAHQSDKYKAGRYLAGGGTLQGAAQLLGPGWTAVGDDVLRAPDGSEFDVYLGFSETGTQRVQWTQTKGPGGVPLSTENPAVTNAGAGGPYGSGTGTTIGGILSGPMPSNWDDEAYLKANPDVAEMRAKMGNTWSGWDHYIKYGNKEGRPGAFKAGTTTGTTYGTTEITTNVVDDWKNPKGPAPSNWDEEAYLQANPDVAKMRAEMGNTWSGWDHYVRYGEKEGRKGAFKTDTGGGGGGGEEEWTNPEGSAPWWWDEAAYLKANPDVAAIIKSSGGTFSGWDHFVRYGRAEGRPGQEDPVRGQLLKILNNEETPSLEDPHLAAQAEVFRNAKQREGDQLRAELAERAAFTGLNLGGAGSGAFETSLIGLREGESDDIAAFEAELLGNEIESQRAQLMSALQIAEAVGARTEANALREKLALLDEQYRRDVHKQDTTNWQEQMDFYWDQLEALINRQAMLDAIG